MYDNSGRKRPFTLRYEQQASQRKILQPILKFDFQVPGVGECDPLKLSRLRRKQLPYEYRHEQYRQD